MSSKNSPFLVVLTWFLILGKIQDGGLEGDHCWWHHMPPAAPPPIKYTLSCREDQRLSTEGKIVSEYSNISKTLGRVPSTPVSPLYHGGGMNLRVRPSVFFLLLFFISHTQTITIHYIYNSLQVTLSFPKRNKKKKEDKFHKKYL